MGKPMVPITVYGQFIFTEGRTFFRDEFDTLWEVKITGDRNCPLSFELLAYIENEDMIPTLVSNL